MRKRELIERITKLEMETQAQTKIFNQEIGRLNKVVNFLSQHNRDEIVINGYLVDSFAKIGTCIMYLCGANLVSVKIPDYNHWHCEIVKKSSDKIMLKFDKCDWGCEYAYYEIDKANGTFHEIPKPAFVLEQELAEKEAKSKLKIAYTSTDSSNKQSVKKEKVSGNKKSEKGAKQEK